MNNSRMWLVVNPTVGLPLLFIGIATTSLIVHAAILTNTKWYPAFYSGKMNAKTADLAPAQKQADAAVKATEGLSAKVVFDTQSKDAVVVLQDGRTARLVFDAPVPGVAALATKLDH